MTPAQMARLHTQAFTGQSRGWSEKEFQSFVQDKHTILVTHPHGFALGRMIAGEAELLTIVTDPEHRRTGCARRLLMKFEADVQAKAACRIFLEVAADNIAALSLYQVAGYRDLARREGYYGRPGGTRVDARVMQKTLT